MGEVFLGREALGDGLKRHDLRRWYKPIFRGVYIPKWSTPSLHDRVVGAWLTSNRTGVIAGVAASALHGADWVDDTEPIEILVDDRRRQPGLLVRTDRLADDEVTMHGELPVTTPARTAFDLGRYQKRSAAIARLDALMRAAPFSADDVSMSMHRYGPVRGVRQLRELLPLVDPGAESPKESWLRLLLIDNGFPIPETQIPVGDGDEPFAFLDMGWRHIQLAVEYDGDHHRTDRPQYVKDMRRLPRIQRCGWEVIRVIAEDRESEILAAVYEAWLRRGGAEIDKMAWATRAFAA
jgi:AbiEi antitoxin C-terminal domain